VNGAVVNAQSAHDRRQRRVLVGIALMFFAPLAVCFYLYYGQVGWRPGGRVNAGDLIEPPRPLPLLALPLLEGGATHADLLRRKWTLLYAASGPCADRCQASLYHTRQVRIALDRDMDRVQRVLIADDGCCDGAFLHTQHPDLIAVRNGPAAAPLLALLPDHPSPSAASGSGAAQAPRVYLIDPLGNLMMSYAADAKPKGMLEDLKRLLRLSSIG
jgi:cytochrome oxidase Cu insertion factor (SCO1/SenC/PrrC family)